MMKVLVMSAGKDASRELNILRINRDGGAWAPDTEGRNISLRAAYSLIYHYTYAAKIRKIATTVPSNALDSL